MSHDRCVLPVGSVLFDMDGVLLDSTSKVERIWRSFAQRHDLDPEDVQAEVDSASEVRALPGAFALTAALVGHPWAIVTSGNRRAAHTAAELRSADHLVRDLSCVHPSDAIEIVAGAAVGLVLRMDCERSASEHQSP